MRRTDFIVGLIFTASLGCATDDADRCTDAPSNRITSLRRAPGFVLEGTVQLPRIQQSLRGLDIGDLDADGRLDLLVSGEQRLWLRSEGESLDFERATLLPGEQPTNSRGLMLGDVDGDGRTEVVIWQDNTVYVLRGASGALPEGPVWISEGFVVGVNIDEDAKQMIVSSERQHTVLDISSGEPTWVEDIPVQRQTGPVRLFDLDGRSPKDLVSPTPSDGSVVTFRDGLEATSVPMLEMLGEAALLRTPWSDRTLVTLPERFGGKTQLWLRQFREDGSGPVTVWSWGDQRIESMSVFDVDADGFDELILHYAGSAVLVRISEEGEVQIIGRIGEMNPRPAWLQGGSIAADLDNNGRDEIVLIGPDDTLEIFSASRQVRPAATCIMPQLPGYLGTSLRWD